VQRPLWASTGTKNPAYPDTIYVDGLIGPDTVNTVPPATLDAFRDHGTAAVTVMDNLEECQQQLAELEKLGISMDVVTDELEAEGVKAFVDAYTALLQTVDERRKAVVDQLGSLTAPAPVPQCVARLEAARAIERMNAIDPTLWTDDPAAFIGLFRRLSFGPQLCHPRLYRPRPGARHRRSVPHRKDAGDRFEQIGRHV
jgi:hypothetical protein